jgi:hypothetical protein
VKFVFVYFSKGAIIDNLFAFQAFWKEPARVAVIAKQSIIYDLHELMVGKSFPAFFTGRAIPVPRFGRCMNAHICQENGVFTNFTNFV